MTKPPSAHHIKNGKHTREFDLKTFVLWIVWAGGLVFIVSQFVKLTQMDHRLPIVQQYTISNLSPQFQEIWSQIDIFSGTNGSEGVGLVATEQGVFFLAALNSWDNALIRYNWLTGERDMDIEVNSRADTLAGKGNLVFVGIRSGQKIDSGTLNGAAQIVAYNASSGKKMWSRRVRGARDIAYISAYANDISVIGSTVAGERYQYLNAANGEVQYSNDANYPVFFTTDTWYIIQPRSRLRAVASNNNTLLWERRFDTETFNYSSVYFAPILDNGIIIGRTGEGVGKIYALDSASGHLLWRSEDIVYGNVAVSQGVTFFLNEQAELKAIDSKTGQVLAIVTFEPETPQERLTQGGRIYNVAANGDIVVVYLGDSRQLFAFRFVR